jgi:hypothetical protein
LSTSADGALEAPAGPSLKGIHVLVVDDEEDTLDVLAHLLRRSGARVTTAMSAGEAYGVLEHQHPDVLLSDIAMPGEDGYALIRRIRRLDPERGGDVPAIALTAFVAPEQRVNALVAGFHIHLPKPVDARELLRVVSGMAHRQRRIPSERGELGAGPGLEGSDQSGRRPQTKGSGP